MIVPYLAALALITYAGWATGEFSLWNVVQLWLGCGLAVLSAVLLRLALSLWRIPEWEWRRLQREEEKRRREAAAFRSLFSRR